MFWGDSWVFWAWISCFFGLSLLRYKIVYIQGLDGLALNMLEMPLLKVAGENTAKLLGNVQSKALYLEHHTGLVI